MQASHVSLFRHSSLQDRLNSVTGSSGGCHLGRWSSWSCCTDAVSIDVPMAWIEILGSCSWSGWHHAHSHALPTAPAGCRRCQGNSTLHDQGPVPQRQLPIQRGQCKRPPGPLVPWSPGPCNDSVQGHPGVCMISTLVLANATKGIHSTEVNFHVLPIFKFS
jgi:hypothetical protein